MNYDDTLIPPAELENECLYCGNPCENNFCSSYCKRGYEYDTLN